MVVLYAFQLLPYLYERRIFPQWEIRSRHFGDPPDFLTIPGVLDLAYDAPTGPCQRIWLHELRRRHSFVLGNDWSYLNRIWNMYFKIPPRILEQADSVMPQGRVLGIHYRGTDKQTTAWDSNPISQEQYLTLVLDFLSNRPDYDVIFAATDEHSFIERLRETTKLPVVALDPVEFFMLENTGTKPSTKADRALLDCVLLSRCMCVLKTSSALSSFAKLLNPDLEIYRCAASKLYTNMPYFPVAHIPILPVTSAESKEILRSSMELDWTLTPNHHGSYKPGVRRPRWPINHAIFNIAERLGIDNLVAKIAHGYR